MKHIFIWVVLIMSSYSIIYQPEPVMPSIQFNCNPLIRVGKCYETYPAIGVKKDGTHKEYKNGCEACRDLKVKYFNRLGPCPKITERRCTEYIQPICGKLKNGTLKHFSNECEACNYAGVESYLARECP